MTIGDLLAVIFRDGGQHRHDIADDEMAIEEAIGIYVSLREQRDKYWNELLQLRNDHAECLNKPEAIQRVRKLLREERRQRKRLSKDLKLVAEQRDEAREMVMDMFNQACRVTQDSVKYDHMCLGPYECVQEKLIKWGLIKKEECVR